MSTICTLLILYISATFSIKTFAISFAISDASEESSLVTDIFINSVSFTELTDIFSLSSSSSTFNLKFDITLLNTSLVFNNSLYVDTNFEFNVISVVVIVFVSLSAFPSDVASTRVAEDVYSGIIYL